MALTTPASPLRYREDNRKVSHGHENVAVIMQAKPQPGQAINLRAMPCVDNSEPSRRPVAGAKSRGPPKIEVRATLANLSDLHPVGLAAEDLGTVEHLHD